MGDHAVVELPASKLVLGLGSLGLYLATLVIYRLVFHPLAKFPGPKLAAATLWYEAYYDVALPGLYTWRIAEMHKRYGPIIRISPHELHISDPKFYQTLYRTDGTWNKYNWAYRAFGSPKSAICAPDHDVHRQRRAAIARFFSRATVTASQQIVTGRVEKFRSRINDCVESGTIIDLGTAFSALTTDISTEYILGESYDNLGRVDFNQGLINMLQGFGGVWRATKHFPFLGPMMKAMPLSWLEKSVDPSLVAFVEFLKKSQRAVKENADDFHSGMETDRPHTLVHEILSSSLPPHEKEIPRLNDELDTITGAGFETSAQTLRFITYHTYTQPKVLRRLRAELRELLPDAEVNTMALTLGQLEKLPYLTAVLMEGLRLSPGVLSRLARIAPDRDLVYDEWVIPAGTPVSMTAALMHRDERVYPEPEKFEPERWMDADAKRRQERSYGPFSRGTRSCLGMHLAWAELYLTMAMVMSRFDIEFVDTGLDEVTPYSDNFLIATKSNKGVKAKVTLAES